MTISISRPGSTKLHKVHYPSSLPVAGEAAVVLLQWPPLPRSRSCPLCVPFPHKLDVTRLQLGPVRYQLLAVKAFCKLLCCLTKLSFCAFMNSHRPARPLPNYEIQLNSGCQ